MDSSQIDLSVYLEKFEKGNTYDRLGNGETTIDFSGVPVPQVKFQLQLVETCQSLLRQLVMNFR